MLTKLTRSHLVGCLVPRRLFFNPFKKETEAGLELQEKIKAAEEQAQLYKNKAAQTLTETESLRKRLNNEIENQKVYAITKFAKELLEVPDNLQRAIDNIPSKEVLQENPQKVIRELHFGTRATREILQGTLMKFEVEEFNPSGEKFDPNKHEVLKVHQSSSQAHDTVCEVFTTGYTLRDRVLRFAKVGVVKKQ